MPSETILSAISRYFASLPEQLGDLFTFSPRRLIDGIVRRRTALIIGVLLFALFQQTYFWSGRTFISARIISHDNAFYGWDPARVIADVTEPGQNRRSNVHPLFVLYAKPLGLFFRQLLGMDPAAATTAVSSCVGAFSVVMMMLLFCLCGAALPEATLFAAIFGASTAQYFLGLFPETGCFSILTIILTYAITRATLRAGRRHEWTWIAVGMFTYGTAVTNFLKTGLGFVLASPWKDRPLPFFARAAAYAFLTIGLAVGLSLSIGSKLDMFKDVWITQPAKRGTDLDQIPLRMVRAFFLYSVVGPNPSYNYVDFYDEKGPVQMRGPIVTFNESTYGTGPGLLAAGWIIMLASGIALALKRRDTEELKMLALAAGCLVWDFAFFSRYYVPFEGFFVWSAHYVVSVFFPVVFLAAAVSRLRPAPRAVANLLFAVFLVGQAANNFWLLRESIRLLESK